MEKFKVVFSPDNKTVEVNKGETILSACLSAGIYINSSCGGDGVCGRCKVIVNKGEVVAQPTGKITMAEKEKNYYLACLTSVHSDLEVEIPVESLLELDELSKEDSGLRLKDFYSEVEDVETIAPVLKDELFTHSPLATKLYLELPEPDLDDKISDLERLYREIRKIQDIPIMQTGLANIRHMGELLRSSDWKVTVTLGNRNGTTEIVFIEPGDTSKNNFGFAFDIGTTTICGQLIDLNNKKVLGTKAAYNRQAAFGSDVITRIIYAKKADGLAKLHHAVIDEINSIIQSLIKEHEINLNDVTCCLCAGNTTMTHLLLKVDPTYIRRSPYVPTANFVPTIRAAEAGIKINPRGLLACVPGVAGYIGGDITAGVISCGVEKQDDLTLLIDIGTNGEIILGNKEFLIGCAASAGPAFEGSGVSCGMRASSGAIMNVEISRQDLGVSFDTIGSVEPRGICGSGYIDLIAQMLRHGIIDKSGLIQDSDSKRVRHTEQGKEFIVAFKDQAQTENDIVITEADIENIKRAKAAIYAGASSLVRHMGFNFEDVKRIFIAGGFGNYIDIDNAKTIGLLPDIDNQRFVFVGNSSLAGAHQALLFNEANKKAEEVASKITYLELSVDAKYMDEYMAALFFPHTDLSKFSSVSVDR